MAAENVIENVILELNNPVFAIRSNSELIEERKNRFRRI